MKVILLQDVRGLGRKGEIKEAAEGYARNFLLARKLAEIATESSIKRVESIKKTQVEKNKAEMEKNRELASQLKDKTFTISVKTKNDKLFGSIHAKDVADVLKKENIVVVEKAIVLPGQIKTTGDFKVKLNFGQGIETFIMISVKSSN